MQYDLRNQITQGRIITQLQELTDPTDDIMDYQQDAFNAYSDGNWPAVTRHIGMAVENLTTHIRDEVYPEMGNNTQGVIDRMIRDDDRPLLQYVGKSLAPAYWLRHQASHDNMPYTADQTDAHYALLSFQTALDTYVEDFRDLEIIY